MNTQPIEVIITTACDAENAGTDLHELLAAVAARNNQDPSEQTLQQGTDFVLDYIRQVPYVIKVAWIAAEQIGLQESMRVVLDAVISYWVQDDDVIPDSLGVVGLLDDAYCTLCSLQMVSDQYRMLSGKHLFPENLTDANQAIRQLLGTPYASDLDGFIMETLNSARIMPALQQLADPEKRLHLDAEHTIWNYDSLPDNPQDILQGILAAQ